MNIEERNKKYNQYVEAKVPMTKDFPTLFYAFIVGGVICMIGQGVQDGLLALFPTLTMEDAAAWMLIILILSMI
jgi:stage V sporulation protein AC